MIPTYIITKEGRSYSTEGLEYVTHLLNDNYDIEDELIFHMGSDLNIPEFLADRLDVNKPVAIIISTKDNVIALYNANGMADVAKYLRKRKNDTSWQILCEEITRHCPQK